MKSALVAPLVLLAAITGTNSARGQEAVMTHGEDTFAAGAEIRAHGREGGDLLVAGGSVDVVALGASDVLVAGGQVDVDGPIREDAFVVGGEVRMTGEVAQDIFVAGGQVRIGRGATVGGDAALAGGSVTLDGDVAGDVAMAGGRLRIGGAIGGDVQATGGRLEILPGAGIAGSVHFRGGEPPVVAPDASIGGEVTYVAERRFAERRWDRRARPGWRGLLVFTLATIVTGIVVYLLMPGIILRAAETLRQRPVVSALIGLALLAGLPLLAVLLVATVIGFPLGAIALMLYPALLFLGVVVAAFGLSELILRRGPATPTPLRRFGFYALAVIVLFVLFAIPWIGGWLALFALLTGLGALGQALFGARRDSLAAA